MTTFTAASVYSQTALASYGDALQSNQSNVDKYTDTDVGMSPTEAQTFDATWEVVEQSTSTMNGFSAVLFRHRTTGEKVLAIAGTDPSSPADLLTDLVNVIALGSVTVMPQYVSLEAFHAQLLSSGKLTAGEPWRSPATAWAVFWRRRSRCATRTRCRPHTPTTRRAWARPNSSWAFSA
jgi:hypothetical protein